MNYQGELFPAKDKKYEELIFFVPFFEGTKVQLRKHIEFVNALGFDAFAFHLWEAPIPPLNISGILNFKKTMKDYAFFSSSGEFGLRHIYADQIEHLLNLFKQPKIVYSFSNPSVGAIKALSLRGCSDIRGLICDSGPSSRFVKSVSKLNDQQKFPHQKLKALGMTLAMSLIWGLQVADDLKNYLDRFPKNFPLLSIRGWKDSLISPAEIDEVFDGHDNLNWTKLSLPEAGHLNGLRDFSADYKPAVASFLRSCATQRSAN